MRITKFGEVSILPKSVQVFQRPLRVVLLNALNLFRTLHQTLRQTLHCC
jgi:hypothetical protein